MRHNLGKRKLNQMFWSVFKEMCFAAVFEHLISGPGIRRLREGYGVE